MYALPHHLRINAANLVLEQGIGQLFPWNVFINAQSYYSRRFCGSMFQKSFEDFFAFAYNLAAIIGLLITLRLVPAQYGALPFQVIVSEMGHHVKVLFVYIASDGSISFMFRYVRVLNNYTS